MTPSRYTLSGRLAPALLAGGAVLAVGGLSWPYTVDDAFIVARYARNLVSGLGYGMNAHQPSDGVTGPLWLLPQCLAIAAGLDPITIAKIVGLATTAAAVTLTVTRLRARAGGSRMAWIAALTCAVVPSLGTWGASGLETGLATGLVTIAALAATARGGVRAEALGACVAALAWLRPELAPACAVLVGAAWLRDRRAGGIAAALALAGLLAVLAFRWSMFGHVLPMAYAAKAGTLGDGAEYLARSLALSTSVVGIPVAMLGGARGRSDDRVIAAVLIGHALAVVLAGGDWMPGYRLLVPVLPLYAWLLAVGATRKLRRPGLVLVLAACSLLVPALDLATRIPELRAAGASQARTAALARWLKDHADSVALVDIGQLGYLSELPLLDLGGLTDPEVAALPGGHLDKHVTSELFRARAPDALVLHAARVPRVAPDGELLTLDGYPVERRVAMLPEVRAHYRVVRRHAHAPGYHYVVLTRTR